MSAPPASESSRRGSSAPPAYASAPRRSGLLVALACVVALAAAGALAMFLFGATAPTSAVPRPPSDEAREAMAAAKAALDEASKSVLQPQGASVPAQDLSPAAAPAPEAGRPEPVAPMASAPAAEPPRTIAAAPADGPRPAPKADAAKPSAPRAAPAPKAAPAPEPVVVAAAPVPEVAPAAPVDRWVQMKSEIAKCWNGSVLGLQCERRVRVRYCEGYWGSVPECSTGRTDHGN